MRRRRGRWDFRWKSSLKEHWMPFFFHGQQDGDEGWITREQMRTRTLWYRGQTGCGLYEASAAKDSRFICFCTADGLTRHFFFFYRLVPPLFSFSSGYSVAWLIHMFISYATKDLITIKRIASGDRGFATTFEFPRRSSPPLRTFMTQITL